MNETTRLLRRNALSGLVADVRARRAQMAIHDPDRDFYLGVEAAAEESLHPELASARSPEWLAHETPAFRDGYEQTQANIAVTATFPEPPPRIRVPEPPNVSQHPR